MKPLVSKALAVGTLVAVTGAAFLFAFTFFKKGGYSKSESYLVHAHFTDATGLTWKSRVQIAGIQVGEVEQIRLDGARALLQIRVKNEVDLREDTCLYKAFPSALLPDALLEVSPGTSPKLLKDLPEKDREITCIREATSVQQLLDSMSKIASDVQTVTGDLAETVTGHNGSLKTIIENLAATTGKLRTLLDENGVSVGQILRNTRDFTHDLRDISSRDKDRIHDILVNVDALSAQLRATTASLETILKGTAVPGGPAAAGKEEGEAKEGVSAGGEEAGEGRSGEGQAKGVQQAVEKLNDSLAKLDGILGKVKEGKSVAGRLLLDDRMGRQVGSAVEGISDYLDRAQRLQVQLQLRSEWLLNQSVTDGRPGAKIYFGARIIPQPDKYYELELVSDPRGVDTVTNQTSTTAINGGTPTTTSTTSTTNQPQALAFSLQMAKRFGLVTLRGGIIESSGGLGADLHLLDDSLRLSMSMYQFNRPQNSAWPRAKLWLDYTVLQHFYLTTGVDDFLNRWQSATRPGGRPFSIGTDVFFGAGIFFNDDDVKMLLTSGVASSAAAAAK